MAKYRIVSKGSLVTVKSKLTKTDKINEREMEYLVNHYTGGLFKVFYDGKKTITYTAPMSVTLEKYLSNRILDQASFWKIILQIVEVAKTADINGLYQNKIWMDMQTVFINEMTQELYFIYQPLVNVQNVANVYAFISDITYMEMKKYAGTQCEYLVSFEQFLKDGNNYRLENIYAYVEGVSPETCHKTRGMGKGRSGFLTSNIASYQKHYREEVDKVEETVYLGGDGTVLLGSGMENDDCDATTILSQRQNAVLFHERSGTPVQITKDSFLLGKGNVSDYCISGNTAVSRRHAVIRRKGNDYYLQDEGSTNGSFLNGRKLEGQETVLLADRDEIVLADERFRIEIK